MASAIAGVPKGFKEDLKAADLAGIGFEAAKQEAMRYAKGETATAIVEDTTEAAKNFNKNAGRLGLSVPIPNAKDPKTINEAGRLLLSNFEAVVGSDPDFLRDSMDARNRAMLQLWEKKKDSEEIYRRYLDELKRLATATATKIYGVSPKTPGLLAKALGSAWEVISGAIPRLLGTVVLPIVLWILTKGAQLLLELQLVLLCFAYPFIFHDTLRKAFIGFANGAAGTALLPSVAFVMLAIFEAIAAQVFKVVLTVIGVGVLFAGAIGPVAIIGYAVFYITGCVLICLKSPKITKMLLEGASPIGTLAGTFLKSAIAGVLGGVGIPAMIAGAGGFAAAGGAGAAAGAAAMANSANPAPVSGAKNLLNPIPKEGNSDASRSMAERVQAAEEQENKEGKGHTSSSPGLRKSLRAARKVAKAASIAGGAVEVSLGAPQIFGQGGDAPETFSIRPLVAAATAVEGGGGGEVQNVSPQAVRIVQALKTMTPQKLKIMARSMPTEPVDEATFRSVVDGMRNKSAAPRIGLN